MNVQMRNELTDAIIGTVASADDCPTATEVAHRLDHSPAVVSGILARLHKQGRVRRGRVELKPDASHPDHDGVGPWHYASLDLPLLARGCVVQQPAERE